MPSVTLPGGSGGRVRLPQVGAGPVQLSAPSSAGTGSPAGASPVP